MKKLCLKCKTKQKGKCCSQCGKALWAHEEIEAIVFRKVCGTNAESPFVKGDHEALSKMMADHPWVEIPDRVLDKGDLDSEYARMSKRNAKHMIIRLARKFIVKKWTKVAGEIVYRYSDSMHDCPHESWSCLANTLSEGLAYWSSLYAERMKVERRDRHKDVSDIKCWDKRSKPSPFIVFDDGPGLTACGLYSRWVNVTHKKKRVTCKECLEEVSLQGAAL